MRMLPIAVLSTLSLLSACEQETMEEPRGAAPMEQEPKAAETEQEPQAATEQELALAEDPGAETPKPVREAVAALHPTEGNAAKGTVRFRAIEGKDGLQVKAEFEGLPAGTHAYHVHLYGDCSGADGKTAGTHFNFQGSSKNPPEDIDRITGNLGEVEAGDDGKGSAEATIENASLTGDYTILGRSVIIHAKGNDPESPPIGAAGARLACGTIGIAEAGKTEHAAL